MACSMARARMAVSARQQATAQQPLSDRRAFALPPSDSLTPIPASNTSDQPHCAATQPAEAAAGAAAAGILSLPSSALSLQLSLLQHEAQAGAAATSSDSSITSDTILQQQQRVLQFATLMSPHLPCHALVPPAFRPRAKLTSSDDDWDVSSASGYFSGASSPVCFRM